MGGLFNSIEDLRASYQAEQLLANWRRANAKRRHIVKKVRRRTYVA
jgi:hypothetical protein